MRVLIVGAGGKLGQALVRAALKQKHHVTALSRRPDSLKALTSNLLAVSQADVLEPGALDLPMARQEAVICTIGIKPTRRQVTVLSQGTENLIRAMQRHNVRRLLCITGIGAGESRGHGGFLYNHFIQPLFLKSMYEDKDRQEKLVRFCDRDWLIIRPARLTDDRARGRFHPVEKMQGVQAAKIPRADVAAWTVAQLEANKYLYRAVVLTE